jgi:lysophospholipase L1-like esterase
MALSVIFALTLVSCGGGSSTPSASPNPTITDSPIYPGGGKPVYATPFGGTQQPFPFSTPEPRTPYPGVPTGYYSPEGNEPLPEIPEGAAVYLSLGDSINYGCCADIQLSSHPRLAHYISQKLNRSVVWISLAGNGTLQTFLHGIAGQTPQLDNAVSLLTRLRDEGHDVVLISLSIGGNDLLALRDMGCRGGGQPQCLTAFSDLMNSYNADMQTVYSKLNEAKDPATPIFQNTIYDALDCGQEDAEITASAVSVKTYNQRMDGAARVGGAFLVDFYEPFKGRACEYISGVDPTYRGYDVILDLDKAMYDALPAEYVDPWRR